MLYALGEIALLVIGILIALQVNNWNEERKDRIKERKVLEELGKNLTLNVHTLESIIITHDETMRQIDFIIDYMDDKKPFSDSIRQFLDRARWSDNIDLSTAAFESLKSYGFELIRSDSLRMEIINLFDHKYETIINTINSMGLSKYNSTNSLYEKYFSARDGKIWPNDPVNFPDNQEFYNMLTLRQDWKELLTGLYLELKNVTAAVNELIIQELDKRK